MKKFLFLLTIISVTFGVTFASAETLNVNTFYPSPFAAYEKLRLVPQPVIAGACKSGSIYSETPGEVKYCKDDGSGNGTGTWEPLEGVWIQSDLDDVYPADTAINTDLNIGIGTTSPESIFFHIHDPNLTVRWTDTSSIFVWFRTIYEYSDMILSSVDPSLIMVGDDAGDGLASIHFVEVNNASGNYQNQWFLARNTSNATPASSFYIGYKTNSGTWFGDPQYQKLTLLPDGNVGINNATPESTLHIKGDGDILLEDDSMGIEFRDTDDASFRIMGGNFDALRFEVGVGAGWPDCMNIYTNGNIGIGIGDPQAQLSVVHTNLTVDYSSGALGNWPTNTNLTLIGDSTGDAGICFIGLDATTRQSSILMSEVDAAGNYTNLWAWGREATTLGTGGFFVSYAHTLSGHFTWHSRYKLSINPPNAFGHTNVGIGTACPQASLDIRNGGEVRLEASSTGIHFIDTDAGDANFQIKTLSLSDLTISTSNPVNPLMCFRDSRRVGIGTTNPTCELDVNGQVRGVGITDDSDIRLKKDIHKIKNTLERITKLQGINYYWKDEGQETGMQMGLTAQEVEKVFPEAVFTDENGYKSLYYEKFTAVIIEAVKELKEKTISRINMLKKENSILNKTFEQQAEKIKELKKKINNL